MASSSIHPKRRTVTGAKYPPWRERLRLNLPSTPPTTDACWEWTGSLTIDGYGYLTVNGKFERAHRASFMATYGCMPKGAIICHRCDNRACCNPHHLYAGTHQDNTDDIWARKRTAQHGEGHHWSKATAQAVREMRALYDWGMKPLEISKLYGLSHGHTQILVGPTRRYWKRDTIR